MELSLDIHSLQSAYADGRLTPEAALDIALARIDAYPDKAVWIHRLSREQIDAQLAAARRRQQAGVSQPLFGIPFAIKDNIDFAGAPTTAACPAFAYTPDQSATAVQRLIDAGAILVGKTNLDQFATGLVGTRSPYGACANTFDGRYISGGSSSGSAVAVAAGLVSFSLGTDTAGSGRVPAAFNNLVGLKPTRGLVSAAGVVPACRSLDCVSIFALTCADAQAVFRVAAGHDEQDPFSRRATELPSAGPIDPKSFRFGVPAEADLRFFGNAAYASRYQAAIDRAKSLGGIPVTIDYAPFAAAAALLYGGPWVAERTLAPRDLLLKNPEAIHPVVRAIVQRGPAVTGIETFEGLHALARLRQKADGVWRQVDVLLLPTAGTIYTRAEVEANPVSLNTNLGYYTNFVNLMDMCAVAVPAGFVGEATAITGTGSAGDANDGSIKSDVDVAGACRLPFGVTLIAPAGQDDSLLALADAIHRSLAGVDEAPSRPDTTSALLAGATKLPLPPTRVESAPPPGVLVAVVGAHLSGQPLNWQLTERRAELVKTCRTAPKYRLVALPGTTPPKPGLIRVGAGNGGEDAGPDTARAASGESGAASSHAGRGNIAGSSIEVEIWRMSFAAFGSFVAAIPPPLGIGSVELEDGTLVKCFLVESYAAEGAEDISHFGGWRAYLKSR